MKHLTAFLALILLTMSVVTVLAQEMHTGDQAAYSIELPSNWRSISEPDAVHEHAEFVNGDRMDGYLQIRKEIVDAGTTPSDLAQRDQDQKLRYIPGFVEGKQEPFSGRLNGVTASYEFTKAGKPMMGRIYYLQADNQLTAFARMTGGRFYQPRFQGELREIFRDIGSDIRNQYSIAYHPTNPKLDGTYRKLKVELIGPDGSPLKIRDQKGKDVKYQIMAREGYTAKHTVE